MCVPVCANAAPPAPDGAVVFRQRCQACHTDEAGKPARVGPNLAGVVGRKAAATDFNYSAALKGSGLTWNRENLDRYLAAPSKAVPGTRMVIALTDPVQRKALIDYLAKKR
jgi:cytochrome c